LIGQTQLNKALGSPKPQPFILPINEIFVLSHEAGKHYICKMITIEGKKLNQFTII